MSEAGFEQQRCLVSAIPRFLLVVPILAFSVSLGQPLLLGSDISGLHFLQVQASALAEEVLNTPSADASERETDTQRFMPIEGAAPAPKGFDAFCEDNPAQCESAGAGEFPNGVRLDVRRWAQLQKVNREVNAAINRVPDQVLYGIAEQWAFPKQGAGDCEDFALEKRRLLLALGWPMETLLVTVGVDREKRGHAVLTVVTEQGDLVLDSKSPAILPWYATPYRYTCRQSAVSPRNWVHIGDNRTTSLPTICK